MIYRSILRDGSDLLRQRFIGLSSLWIQQTSLYLVSFHFDSRFINCRRLQFAEKLINILYPIRPPFDGLPELMLGFTLVLSSVLSSVRQPFDSLFELMVCFASAFFGLVSSLVRWPLRFFGFPDLMLCFGSAAV